MYLVVSMGFLKAVAIMLDLWLHNKFVHIVYNIPHVLTNNRQK